MSMILEALSRAEKERQADNNIGLDTARYVTSSTIKEDRFKRWVLITLVANFVLVSALAGTYVWKNYVKSEQPVVTNISHQPVEQTLVVENQSVEAIETSHNALSEQKTIAEESLPSTINIIDDSANASSATSLLDEARVKSNKQIASVSKKAAVKKKAKVIPPVQYSSQPLTQVTPSKKPTVASISKAVAREQQVNTAGTFTKLTDMPTAQRAQLGQYEVNVHVYDDNPQSRFVLINMVKYKEGDRLSGGNASVSSIVPEGVVLNYGSQQVLIERNQ